MLDTYSNIDRSKIRHFVHLLDRLEEIGPSGVKLKLKLKRGHIWRERITMKG